MLLFEIPRCEIDWYWRAGLEYPLCAAFAAFAVFAFGSCLGSFLNVCIWRIPRGESVVNAPSHCTSCGAEIRWFDNLPVISYLVLRGRCRHCHQAYSPRYLIVETLTGLLFVAAFFKAGLAVQPPGVIASYWTMILLAIASAWIDAEHRIIPDLLTWPGMLLGLLFAALFPEVWGEPDALRAVAVSLVSGVGPALALWLFSLVGSRLAGREVLGLGDVKFVAAAGMLLGLTGVLVTLFIGSFTGAVVGGVLALREKRRLSGASIAFGPFLAAGALIWIFFASQLLMLLRCGS